MGSSENIRVSFEHLGVPLQNVALQDLPGPTPSVRTTASDYFLPTAQEQQTTGDHPSSKSPENVRATTVDSTAQLLAQTHVHTTSQPSKAKPSLFKVLLNTFKWNFVYSIKAKLGCRKIEEERKVAIYDNRSYAVIQCAVHSLPVCAASIIVVVNILEHYVGHELEGWERPDSEKLTALQFAAKLHELFMLASLSVVAFTAIRRELTGG